MTLRDKVIEDGELESQQTIKGNCEIDDWNNKLIFLAPEGELVKKGQVVARFDSSEIEEEVSDRMTRVNDKKSDVDKAEQELKVQKDENVKNILAAEKAEESARLDLEKYLKGDYVVKISELEVEISESTTAVEKARRALSSTRTLVKGGFTDYGSLREAEQILKSAQSKRRINVQRLSTYQTFEHVQTRTSLEGKYESSKNDHAVAKTTAVAKLKQAEDLLKNEKQGLKIEKRRLEEKKLDQERHTMYAPEKGTLLYAKDRYNDNEKVHEGSTIYRNQPVFVLPDMGRMQVKVGVHESLIGKIKPKQPALVRVDAFSNQALKGSVESVALLSDSRGNDATNSYSVIVKIKSFPEDAKLKPGMSANVEILVGTYPDVLAVPIQAITSFGRKKFVFVKNAENEFEPREVELGESNTSFMVIKSGVEAGEVVSLDAWERGLREFKQEEPEEDTEELLAEMAAQAELDALDEPPTPRKVKPDDGEGGDKEKAEDQAEDQEEDQEEDGDNAEEKAQEAQPAESSESTTQQTKLPHPSGRTHRNASQSLANTPALTFKVNDSLCRRCEYASRTYPNSPSESGSGFAFSPDCSTFPHHV